MFRFKRKHRAVKGKLMARLLYAMEQRRLNPVKLNSYGGTRWVKNDSRA